jgi:hypothetical protein
MKVLKKLSEYWKKLLSLPQVQGLRNKLDKHPIIELQLYLWCFFAVCLILLLILSAFGCTEQSRRIFKDSVVSATDCAFHTSLACASQAAAGCEKPSNGEGYGEFGQCLVNRSASCSGRGLGVCLLKGIANVIGSTSVAAGGAGCVGSNSLDQVKACVADVTIETESDAVQTVAYCYRHVCMEGPGTEP